MKRIILVPIIALIFIIGILLLPFTTVSVKGGYAYGSQFVQLSDFTSIEELEAFLRADNTDSKVYLKADKNGVVRFNNQCEDRAFQLRDRAALEGKRIETEVLDRNEYHKWYGEWIPYNHYHVICKAVIGNDWWYIEPDNDKHWIGLHLD